MLVCLGLWVGTAVRSARVQVMGFLGFFAAPAAFEISRVVHKGAIQALAISGSAGDDLSPFLLAVIKGLEYGCLGLALGWGCHRDPLPGRLLAGPLLRRSVGVQYGELRLTRFECISSVYYSAVHKAN